MGSGKKRRIVRKNPALYSSPRITSKRRAYNLKPIFSLVKIIFPILLLIYFTFYSNYFSLKSIEVSGNKKVKTEDILKHLGLGENIFLLETEEIESIIIKNIPEISHLSVYKGIPNAIKIIVTENEPYLTWLSGGVNYLVNSEGVAYKQVVSSDIEYANLPIVIDEQNMPVSIGDKIVSNNFLVFIKNIDENMYTVTNLEPELYSVKETTIDIYVKTKENLIIKFDSLRSYSQQLENLKIVLMEKRNETKEYIDLRINGWVYIK